MSQNVHATMGGLFNKGSFDGTNSYAIPMKYCPIPATVWVRPSAGTVTVSYSTDDGANWTTVTTLSAVAAYSEAVLTGPVTHLKFAGDGATAAGTWGIC